MDASKSEMLEGDSQESTQFRDEEGLLYLKSNTADIIMTCNSDLLRAFEPHTRICDSLMKVDLVSKVKRVQYNNSGSVLDNVI